MFCSVGSYRPMSGASAPSTTSVRLMPPPRNAERLRLSRQSSPPRRDFAGRVMSAESCAASACSAACACPTLTRSPYSSPILDPWVEVEIEQVDEQVDQGEEAGDDQDRALDDREVAVADGLDQQPADSRVGEEGLGD